MAARYLAVTANRAKGANPSSARRASFNQSYLEVRMFNVGDGEAVLVVFPSKRAWLVDGGASTGDARNKALGANLAAYLKSKGLTLEALVPTHPHKDHVGAVAPLLRKKPMLATPLHLYYTGDPSWNGPTPWIGDLEVELKKLGSKLERVYLKDAHREVSLGPGVSAHLFAGSGAGKYTSVFLHLRFGSARLLFTGDAYCDYELGLLGRYGQGDFRADLLKVTHHGSSGGTAKKLLEAVEPGIAIASTAEDDGHRLEKDTLGRLGGRPGPRAIYETLVDGDIVVRTDGKPYGTGVLYQVDFLWPGAFPGASTQALGAVNLKRTTSSHYPACS